MRVSFPNNEHADVLIAPGDTPIGTAADNAIVLSAPGIAPHHATLKVMQRRTLITAGDAHSRIHVNARPVVEKALLRLGDMVSLDTVKFVLKPDSDDSIRSEMPAHPTPTPDGTPGGAAAIRSLPPRVVLRGVSGSYFGRIVPVRGRLVIGSASDCGMVLDEADMAPHHAVVENAGDGIYLRGQDGAGGMSVNGVQKQNAVLHTDDQIAFGRNRFVIEAPSLPTREDLAPVASAREANITQTLRAIEAPRQDSESPVAEPQRNDIWWLIGAAALIAAGVAALLYVNF